MPDDDLAALHALLGHFARQLWDIQKQRIAAGNRVAAMERDGLGDHTGPADAVVAYYAQMEREIERELVRLTKKHFLRPWIEAQRGIGLPGFARLLGVTGSLDRFPSPAKLWKYLGLHVVDGHAPRREKGVPWTHTDCTFGHLVTCTPACTTDHHPNCVPGGTGTAYSPQGRVVCHQLGEAIVKVGGGGEYRRAYDAKKAEYLVRLRTGPSLCPAGHTHKTTTGRIIACVKVDADSKETSAHVHQMAMRYAVKLLIRNLWREWHLRRGHMISEAPYGDVPGNPTHYRCSCSIGRRGQEVNDTHFTFATPDRELVPA